MKTEILYRHYNKIIVDSFSVLIACFVILMFWVDYVWCEVCVVVVADPHIGVQNSAPCIVSVLYHYYNVYVYIPPIPLCNGPSVIVLSCL